jgi:hypothetical protein
MDMACDTYGGQERCVKVFSWKPNGKGPLGTLRCRWEDNIKIHFKEIGTEV